MVRALIYFTLLFIVVAFMLYACYCLATGTKIRLSPAKITSKKIKRSSDQRRLSKHERRTYQRAVEMSKAGKYVTAAQLLESIGLMRECITVLESSGHIKEAASTLMRMQRPNRAGVVYARNKRWREAAQCFKIAEMPLEEARCLKEAQEWEQAASIFKRINRFEEAASCYELAKMRPEAARLYAKLDLEQKALELYMDFIHQDTDFESLRLDKAEQRILMNYLVEQEVHVGFVKALEHHKKIYRVLLHLLSSDDFDRTSAIYPILSNDISKELMSEVNYLDHSATNLAHLFFTHNEFLQAGMVYERLEDYEKAARAFEKGQDNDRAGYCYQRSGNIEKYNELKQQTRNKTTAPLPTIDHSSHYPSDSNPFSLQGISESDEQLAQANDFGNEKTVVVSEDQFEAIAAAKDMAMGNDIKDPRQCFAMYPLFNELSTSERDILWNLGTLRSYYAKQQLIAFGDKPEGLLVILSGTVATYIGTDEAREFIKELGPGDAVGEAWVFADHFDEVCIEASCDTDVHLISKGDLIQAMHNHGTVAHSLYKNFTKQVLGKVINNQNKRANLKAV